MSDDLVLTPGGLRPASLLHRVEEGEVLHAANGVVHKLALDTGNFSLAVESLAQVSLRHADSAALGSGWISDAYWNNGTGNTIQSFTADWVVPPMPATQSGQLIYLFNGIQNYGN